MRVIRGFTLIEMMVSIALVTAMSGVLLAQYRGYNRQQAVKNTAERLKQVFIEARSNAQSGKKDCAVCGGLDGKCNELNDARLTGWKVIINPTTPTVINRGYRIEGHCAPLVGGVPTDTAFMSRTEEFADNISVSTPADPDILFKPLNGGTDYSGNMSIQVTSGTITASVVVASDGEVSITL